MARTRVKICGIMRPQDAIAAAEAGADAIGLIFYEKAGRKINLDQARDIISVLPAFVTPVALFVDALANTIRQVTTTLRIRHVQLHGKESPTLVNDLRDMTILKAIRTDRTTIKHDIDLWLRAAQHQRLHNLRGFVMDTPGVTQAGGTGKENDWEAISLVRETIPKSIDLIAAGGLTPENVASVVRNLRPYAVDVSSGVESQFGEKSADKIRAFIAAVRDGETSY